MLSLIHLGTLLLFYCYGFSEGYELHGSVNTVPVLLWSNEITFSKTQIINTVTTDDVKFVISSLFKEHTYKGTRVDGSLYQDTDNPELIILFVEPELRTDQVPYIASAYNSVLSGSFTHLKNAIDAARSTMSMPYAAISTPTLLDEIMLEFVDKSSRTGSIYLSSNGGSPLFNHLKQNSHVKSVAMDDLMGSLTSNNVFNNGVTDFVVVCFDEDSDFSQHDQIIGTLINDISLKGTYVGIYTSNMPVAAKFVWTFEEHSKDEFTRALNSYMALDDSSEAPDSSNSSNSTNSTTHKHHHKINYFPGAFIEVLLVCAILITMLFTGACAIFSLQTPDKWEAPRTKREI